MNKTVNINLANILFHIDEKAFQKLQLYLESIKRSFSGTTGSEEIIADIEARIAELFQEKMESDRQVVTLKEVEEVIQIMGQPEDYMIDSDIFEDEPARTTIPRSKVKKLYRDIDHKYIGGVCSGLEHYMGFDALWIRLIFILLGVFTGFGFIAYILLWILVPEARTTSQKLDMTGEPVNISNIERKVKEGFEDVGDRIRNVDYSKVKSSGQTFFDTLGDIIMFIFKVIGKFIGILLIIIGAATLIGLFIGLFSVGILDLIHIPGLDLYDLVNSTEVPVWLVSILAFFAVGIPFFFVLYLGLKILVNNLNSIGNIAKFSLLGLWLLSIIGLIVLGVQQAASHAYNGSVTNREPLQIATGMDTVRISMQSNDLYVNDNHMGINGMSVVHNEEGERLLFRDNVNLDIRKSADSLAHIHIRKEADGNSSENARNRAGKIDYNYQTQGKTVLLNDYLTTDISNKVRDQEVRVAVLLPVGTIVYLDQSTEHHIGRSTRYDKDFYRSDMVGHYWAMSDNGELRCLDCPAEEEAGENDQGGRIIIDENGVDIDVRDNQDSFRLKIDESGVKVKANDI
jgi:phage shock protein PspC (stress-responsive transcriptional regulator)